MLRRVPSAMRVTPNVGIRSSQFWVRSTLRVRRMRIVESYLDLQISLLVSIDGIRGGEAQQLEQAPAANHSKRRATMGSMPAARCAGRTAATNAARPKFAGAPYRKRRLRSSLPA